MSQQMRRTLAAVGVAVVLLLALPAPSRAASFRESPFARGLVDQVRAWLWSLMPVSPDPQGPAPAQRTGTTSTSPIPVPSSTTTDDQGSMIDPDGKP